MNEANAGFDLNDEEKLIEEVSDEALETAACAGPEHGRAFTLVMCTGQSECPY